MTEKHRKLLIICLHTFFCSWLFGQSSNCAPIMAPWFESFDSIPWQAGTSSKMGQIDSCWTRPNGGINTVDFRCNKGLTPTSGTGPSGGQGGSGNYLYSQAVGNSFKTGEITSPPIMIPSGYADAHLKFAYHMYGSFVDFLKIEIDSGSGFGNSLKTISGQQQNSSTDPWKFDSISVGSFMGDTIRVKFLARNFGNKGDVCIDDVEIFLTPICSKPAALRLVKSTPQSLEVSWTSNNAMGQSSVSYRALGSPNIKYLSSVTSPLTIQGLSPATDYLVTVFDSCQANQSVKVSDTFSTQNCPSISAQFSYNKKYLDVNFNSTNSKADSLYWDFGDGNNDTTKNPRHIYATPGSYKVLLQVYLNCGNDDTISRRLNVCDTLSARIKYKIFKDSVIFFADSVNGASGYKWNLDNGQTATGKTVGVKYDSAGSKYIELTIFNSCSDSLIIRRTINICPSPIADWSYHIIQTTSSGMEVQFNGSKSENVSKFLWVFGDGNLDSSSIQPRHTYLTPSLQYEITLSVENACGEHDSFTSTLAASVGREELTSHPDIEIYPNPTRRRIKINWNKNLLEPESIRVFNELGRLVYEVPVTKNRKSVKIDTKKWPIGIYLLQINVSDSVFTYRISKL